MNDEGPPPNLPDLDLLRRIGSGAYGEVWLAENRTTRRLLAVKVIRLGVSDAADRAAREIKALVALDTGGPAPHENLLTIHHVGQTDEFFFYTMDPADDVSARPASTDPSYQPATLARRMGAGPLPPMECLAWAEQLLAGLAHLHGAGLVHRDIKPTNCLFVGGRLKLADFGLVAESDGTASLVGTPKYMPPDRRMDARADVYAAGLTIYEMFTGLSAERFPEWSPEALQRRSHPILMALNRLVLRACQRDPSQRFGDAREMLAALHALRVKAKLRGRSLRKPLALAVAGLVAVAAAVAAVSWASRPRGGPTEPPVVSGGHVDVNFITMPFEAEILLDGKQAVDPSGQPYRTPCTVPKLPARVHRVVFRRSGLPDLEVGERDFAATREVVAEWPGSKNP